MTDEPISKIGNWLLETVPMSMDQDQVDKFLSTLGAFGSAGMWVEWTPEGMGYLPVNTLWPDTLAPQSQNSDSAGVRITPPDTL